MDELRGRLDGPFLAVPAEFLCRMGKIHERSVCCYDYVEPATGHPAIPYKRRNRYEIDPQLDDEKAK